MIVAFADGAVQLYYDNAIKLATTATGIDVTGNMIADGVGIGTSSPARALHVNSASGIVGTIEGSTATSFLSFNNSSLANDSTIKLGADGNNLTFYANSAERLRIDSSGNLLVGTTNANNVSDGIRLKPDGFISAANTSGPVLYANRLSTDGSILSFQKDGANVGSIGTFATDITIGKTGAGLRFEDSTQTIRPHNISTNTGNDANVTLGNSDTRFKDLYLSGGLRGDTLTFGNLAGTERMRIDSSGKVGIGESNPEFPLDIQADSAANAIQIIGRSSDNIGQITFTSNDKTTDYLDLQVGSSELRFQGRGSIPMTFRIDETERMRIDSSGNLLVGKSSASSSLVGAQLNANGTLTATVDGARTAILNRLTSDGEIVDFRKGGTIVGSISVTSSATAYNTSSDQRLKDNIADADDAGSKIDSIQVRKYDWKADGSHQDYGMVAQELLEVAPEAVSVPEDSEEMMGVDYSKLVPMLIKEIQSLRNRVAQLETGE